MNVSTERLSNSGKHIYLALANESIEKLNSNVSRNLSISRKCMIISGLISDAYGIRKVEQLTDVVQSVVKENPDYFSGIDTNQ